MKHAIAVTALVVGCRGDEPAPAPAPIPTKPVAIAIDAAPPVVVPTPTPIAPPPHCASSARKFRFGTLTAPAGWCWQRTEEGDDQSGVLADATGAIKARYTELSFGESVNDGCDAHRPGGGVRDVKDVRIAGVAVRTCDLKADGRHCASFHGAANLCSVSPDVTLDALLATLSPAKR